MKKIISKITVIICLMSGLVSCSQNENKINSEIVDYFNKNAKDPKSYEFIDLVFLDTIHVDKCARLSIENNNSIIENQKSYIDKYKRFIKREQEEIKKTSASGFSTQTTKELNENSYNSIKEYEKMIESDIKLIPQFENQNLILPNFFGNNEIVTYVALHKYRLKNGFGGLDLYEKYIVFDKDFHVLSISDDMYDGDYISTRKEFRKKYLNEK